MTLTDHYYVVAHIQKFKGTDLTPMELHFDHAAKNSSNKDIDSSKTYLNYNICDLNDNACHLRELVREKVHARSNNKTKLRKDAIQFCSVLVSASPNFFTDKTPEQIQNYFECAKDCLDKMFGSSNCVCAMVHMDETTPHMHYVFVPLTRDNELCAKKIINRSSLTKLQNELPTFLQEHGFDVCRGIVNSPLSHIKTRTWKRDELLKESLQEELLKELEVDVRPETKILGRGKTGNVILNENDFEKIKSIAGQLVGLIENNSEIIRRRNEMEALQSQLDEQKKEIIQKMKEQQQIAAQLTADQRKLVDRERAVENYKKILEAQDKDIALQKLADDLERQKQQLKQEQIKFDKKIIERVQSVRDVAKKLVLEEIKKEGEQGKYSKEALKVLKEKYPETFDEVIKVAGKKLKDKVNSKVQKIIEQDLLPPK